MWKSFAKGNPLNLQCCQYFEMSMSWAGFEPECSPKPMGILRLSMLGDSQASGAQVDQESTRCGPVEQNQVSNASGLCQAEERIVAIAC